MVVEMSEKVKYKEVECENGKMKLIREDQTPSNPKDYLRTVGGKVSYMDLQPSDEALKSIGIAPVSDFNDFVETWFFMLNQLAETSIKPTLLTTKTQYEEYVNSEKKSDAKKPSTETMLEKSDFETLQKLESEYIDLEKWLHARRNPENGTKRFTDAEVKELLEAYEHDKKLLSGKTEKPKPKKLTIG